MLIADRVVQVFAKDDEAASLALRAGSCPHRA